jgi:adenylate cyclase
MSAVEEINAWLMDEGRRLGDGVAVVEGYATRLVAAGVPLLRANIAQRLSNPLLTAWGMIWTRESTTPYEVARVQLDTSSYIGGPFHYVREHRKPLQKSLRGLDRAHEHPAYLDLADKGGTDIFANLLEYGDGSEQGCTYVSDAPDGFAPEHIAMIQGTRHGLAPALEPVAMRRSLESLLQTYLGKGPARAVREGTIQRGEHTALEAVIMFSDLRGFTAKSETWRAEALLAALDGYFDVVVQAVESRHGEVLKFMGDGILSIFPISEALDADQCCRHTTDAAHAVLAAMDDLNAERVAQDDAPLAIGIGINRGLVTYGNIGSPGRLDFTVLGPAVNVASRIQDLCKVLGEPALATSAVASCQPDRFTSRGSHAINGVAEPVEVFALKA